ncbi:uracil-DNA glycosylase [Rosistilla oblonga]|uniref:uracil-DNA glycosylase n=1 Tax=Rosistilla oblonga TaxID=2527990 RepID=UPI003A978E55
MNEVPSANLNLPDPSEIRVGVGQLLTHLQRVGVEYLPAADPGRAEQWTTTLLASVAQPAPVAAEPSAAASATPEGLGQPAAAATPAAAPPVAAPVAPVAAPPAAAPPAAAPPQPAAIPPAAAPQTPPPAARPKPAAAAPGPTIYRTASLPIADRQASLDHWGQQVAQCTLCHELACTRKQTVFGAGHAQARVVFFGEAPGADEDREGIPFVGRAGQLLTKIIEATKLSRDEVYIMNTLKCRPPGNRNPLPDELKNCRPFFEAQLEIIQPEYIVCLGLFAAQSLLQSAPSIGRMRGRFHNYHGSKVVVTYHPSYLLRNAKMKGAVWQDMQMMMRAMGTLPA